MPKQISQRRRYKNIRGLEKKTGKKTEAEKEKIAKEEKKT